MTTANIPRLCLAASSSGAGKTTVTCALLAAFKARGLNITAFKCGPDYIDPLFHREICGTPSSNLDLFMLDAETVLSLFERRAAGSGLALIEGVMGLYDGIGISEKGSTWEAARLTHTPVVLVEDCRASSLSAAARISGLARFREPRLVRGVILNNCGETLFGELKKAIERETGISVYGFLPYLKECRIESRHLGLLTPEDIENVRQKIALLCEAAQKNIDLEGLLELAKSQTPPAVDAQAAQAIEAEIPQALCGVPLRGAPQRCAPLCGAQHNAEELERKARSAPARGQMRPKSSPAVIAVARDRAFCFYYEDALVLLAELGAQLRYFSPLAGDALPRGAQGLYLGGGYPELYAEGLAANAALRGEIREAVRDGLPCLAECGGFMYLHETLFDGAGRGWPMCGALSGACRRTARLVRFGYAAYTARHDTLLCGRGEVLRGHEFHYWESDDPGADFEAEKPAGGAKWDAVIARDNLFAGFPHFHLCGNRAAAARFVERCSIYGR